jgi:hypothetical protein
MISGMWRGDLYIQLFMLSLFNIILINIYGIYK